MLSEIAWLALASSALTLPEHSPRPGGVVVIELPANDEKPDARYDGKPILVVPNGDAWNAVVGVPLKAAAGPAKLTIDGAERREIEFEIAEHAYREQRLSVERKYVEPNQDALDRIIAERRIIDAALNSYSPEIPQRMQFAAPVPGKRSPSFGFRRVFNDQPRSPHSGMDIAAPLGTPILAPTKAVVAATGDFYFTGNTVILDHGQGFVTLYCHLQRIDVAEGQEVDAGTTLGLVGATGRVTGPHLHMSVYLNGAAVDPALFLTDGNL